MTSRHLPDLPDTPLSPSILSATLPGERLGYAFSLLLVWLFYEFGRPSHPLGVPLLISAIAFFTWVASKERQWQPYTKWWFAILLVMVVGTPLAQNTYSAFWATKGMAVLFLTICLPLQSQLTSVYRVRLWIFTLLAVTLYVGGWAALHGGFGPSASNGGQDENYIAAMMGMSIGLAYFAFLAERQRWRKATLAIAMLVYLAAIAKGQNPSRGGFLGLCAVALYCAAQSPRKRVAFGVLGLLGLALVVFAGPAFWAEIRTSTDYKDGTGDYRVEVWKAGLRMWAGNPVLGVGAGNFRWVIGDYQSVEQFAKFGRSLGGSVIAHSLPIEMVAELGSLGALAMIALTWGVWRGLGRVRKEARSTVRSGLDPDGRRALGLYADALRAAILAILVNGIFLSLFYFSHVWVLLAAGSAVVAVWDRSRAQSSEPLVGSASAIAQRPSAPGPGEPSPRRRFTPTRRGVPQ